MLSIERIVQLSTMPEVERELVENLLMSVYTNRCRLVALSRIISLINRETIEWATAKSLIIGVTEAFSGIERDNCRGCTIEELMHEKFDRVHDRTLDMLLANLLNDLGWK